jgi:hypothetical protein
MQNQAKTVAEWRELSTAEAFCESRLDVGRVALSLSDLMKMLGSCGHDCTMKPESQSL